MRSNVMCCRNYPTVRCPTPAHLLDLRVFINNDLNSRSEDRDAMHHSVINPFTADTVKAALHFAIAYWSNPLFLIFDIRAFWRSGLSARAPECQKLKIVG